ncbi:MAG: acetoin utilization protein AcuC [Coriobacteriia bacterium]|nr:acetoin utilization protein AcuC [Coriobacteriia bacterium]
MTRPKHGVELIYAPAVAGYRFPAGHPMQPERFTLCVELARMWGLLDEGGARAVEPPTATDEDLLLVHSLDYLEHVKAVSESPESADSSRGLGPGDTPAIRDLHAAAALGVGGTIDALEAIASGRASRTFSPAGGMHHAHRDRASGFCVYNDLAVAIERAIERHPSLRVAYIDIDAHHGDGVQEVFAERSNVLTVSVHESGRYLFPGTGDARDRGTGAGEGFALNVPLEPHTDDEGFNAAIERFVVPAVTEFAPHVILAQLGADTHVDDPLAHLDVSLAGYVAAVRRLVTLADDVCGGRIACTGGGGYQPYSMVPVMWASVLAVLLDVDVPETPPDEWQALAAAAASASKTSGEAWSRS